MTAVKKSSGRPADWRAKTKNAGPKAGVLENLVLSGLLPILLDARGAQAGETVAVDGILPGQELFDGQRIAAAGFFQ